ncbi:hypothetical protein A0O34_04520 [Chryseobacterium glaciei]|uniref:Peptidase S74 domain-containing protein n=1 Tax=Chryseobacterium glaciei TaxID=1685010 RepID=A0A172XSE9_9FLAO|nr:tail fiber domain-containing protein [Chryseobacterium glaciei]ANF49846.1 hypothetical protein A0O34_04520 [Chryseobacterium glaciei]
MKKKLSLAVTLFLSVYSYAQVGINTAAPAATFDIVAKGNATTAEGIIAPRLTGLEIKTATSSSLYTTAQSGAIVYATSAQPVTPITPASANVSAPGYYYWDGALWQKFDINLYQHDGSLAANRVVSMADKTLSFNPGTTQLVNQFSVDGNTFSVDALNNRIGINNSAPFNELSLSNNTFGSNQTDVNGKKFAIYNGGNADFYGLGISSGILQFHAASTPNEAPGMVLNGYGYLGVGLMGADPTHRLHIIPELGFDPVRIQGLNEDLTAPNVLAVTSTGVFKTIPKTGLGAASLWTLTGNNLYPATLTNNVGIGTTTPSSLLQVNGTITANRIQGPSDSRFKKNVTPIKNALEKVISLGGYTYDWKDASEFPNQSIGKGHDMGVIAQEVEKVFPEAVTTNKEGYKAVNYQALVPALIEAIKAQQAQINALQAQVNKLTK